MAAHYLPGLLAFAERATLPLSGRDARLCRCRGGTPDFAALRAATLARSCREEGARLSRIPVWDNCDPTLGCEEFLFFLNAARFGGGDAAAVGHAAWRPVPPAAALTLAFIGPSAAVTADPTEGIRRRSRRPTARALVEAGTSGRRE